MSKSQKKKAAAAARKKNAAVVEITSQFDEISLNKKGKFR